MNRPLLPGLLLLAACGSEAAVCAGCGGDGGSDSSVDAATGKLGFPTEGNFYHGVFPPAGPGEDDIVEADVAAYEAAVVRQVAWVTFAHNWYDGAEFPAATAGWIRDRGAVPFIRLMLRSSAAVATGPDPTYGLAAIADGSFDAELAAWADGAAAHGQPVVVAWGIEPNLDRRPWSAAWNGEAAGAAAYVAAYRHIHAVMTARADNLTWVWQVAAADAPADSWNQLEGYYPGDDVVDWMALSIYGGRTPDDPAYPTLREQLDLVAPRLAPLAPARPVMLAEIGASGGHATGDVLMWADDALRDVLGVRWPQVRGFAWHDDDDDDTGAAMRVATVEDLALTLQIRVSTHSAIYDRPIRY